MQRIKCWWLVSGIIFSVTITSAYPRCDELGTTREYVGLGMCFVGANSLTLTLKQGLWDLRTYVFDETAADSYVRSRKNFKNFSIRLIMSSSIFLTGFIFSHCEYTNTLHKNPI